MNRHQKKISITIDPELLSNLDYVAARLGVSRSAVISECLREPMAEMRALFDKLPLNPTPAEVVRFRGESSAVVKDRISSAQGLANDLLAD